jgi:hypothetical protein
MTGSSLWSTISRASSFMSNITNIVSISFAGSNRDYSAIQIRIDGEAVLDPYPTASMILGIKLADKQIRGYSRKPNR